LSRALSARTALIDHAQLISLISITTPGQLQDVTMDSSYAMSHRSPPFQLSGGNTSPGQVRSIREHDEQLNDLRKENFNLKLRIYFMEEKNSPTNLPESSESLIKENVDLKVQAEALRVELKEKQNLLCEAATALELMEQTQKAREDACQSTMEIQSMEKHRDNAGFNHYEGQSIVDVNVDLKMESSARESAERRVDSTEQLKRIGELLRQKEEEVEVWEKKYNKISEEFAKLKESVSNNIEKCSAEHGTTVSAAKSSSTLVKSNKSNNDIRLKIISEQSRLLQQLHKGNSTNDSIKELAEKDCMIITLEDQLQEKSAALEKACKTVQFFMTNQKSLEKEINQLRLKSEVQGGAVSTDCVSSVKENVLAFSCQMSGRNCLI
ncbi:Centrosomin, partial [Pseudolycoriella hygida]